MNKDREMRIASETDRLLAELDEAIDQSSAMREIVDKYEYLRSLESIVGPSRITRVLRQEIESMERELECERYQQTLSPEVNYSPS